jgi:hypothetical protein
MAKPQKKAKPEKDEVREERILMEIRFIRRKRAPPEELQGSAYPTNSYLVSWIARIFSLKNSLSRNP